MQRNGRCLIGMALLVLVAAAVGGCARQSEKVQRFGQVIGVKKEAIPEYKRLHANTWPGVLKAIRECNIRNYSIYLAEIKPDEYYLFAYFEYVGDDFEKDMEKMKADPTTRKWWKFTDPLQQPLPTRQPGEWWHKGEEVFHTD